MFVALMVAAATQVASAPPAVAASAAAPLSSPVSVKPVSVTALDDRMICKTEESTGSNIPTRICHTSRQWKQIQETGQDMLHDTIERELRVNCVRTSSGCGS